MRDDQHPDPEHRQEDGNAAFEDALDDLFGADATSLDSDSQAPTPEKSPRTSPAPQSRPPLTSPPHPRSAPAGKIRKHWWRWLAIGCGVLVSLPMMCIAILFVIGVMVGEDADSLEAAPTIPGTPQTNSLCAVRPGSADRARSLAASKSEIPCSALDNASLRGFVSDVFALRSSFRDLIADANQFVS